MKYELLAPAGDVQKAMFAIDYGADAVFLGAKAYSLRSSASNFFFKDIKQTVDYAHERNRKVYVAVNVVCHNPLVKGFAKFIASLEETGVDGLIVADPFIIDYTKKHHPNLDLHLSTQQSVTNSKSALFWKSNGLSRVVLAREVTMDELSLLMPKVKDKVEIEYFIHGAVCIAFSGRCMMSNNWSLRDANVGGCAQSCRWRYELKDDKQQHHSDSFTMSPKDMALIDEIKQLMKLGVASFKVEGRMKSINYVATVIRSYRHAMDYYLANGFNTNKEDEKVILDQVKQDLKSAENRPVNKGFAHNQPGIDAMLYHEEERKISQTFAFIVDEIQDDGYIKVTCKNNFKKAQEYIIYGPNFKIDQVKITSLLNKNKEVVEVANDPMSTYYLKFDQHYDLIKNSIGHIKKTLDY
ncbi:U32 family peptidase [Mycoplasmoides gallisepticum]|uniref:peptidase U32 family protein n=1 Tax=Mycoplasmoides gallisepticum TaxID=2096 RepID=UPI001243D0CA|nr:U32 family peptidase [Mycoplasmoides gallisepticum]QEX47078.1 U32 family peptidase [Mycoplasmoides gallisepticum]ULH62390.1 U32 family peptidase [Mycoplasmoides gallisepticum]ULH67729.1 U32 family peptidase [Mycoplasmoides gallisepticum]ULH68456.1 U32 family peptidase [Mycoplasmoides gallisepticum]WGG24101.1 U32 family peptidase [Mycoplasmoides gallisepticum]